MKKAHRTTAIQLGDEVAEVEQRTSGCDADYANAVSSIDCNTEEGRNYTKSEACSRTYVATRSYFSAGQ